MWISHILIDPKALSSPHIFWGTKSIGVPLQAEGVIQHLQLILVRVNEGGGMNVLKDMPLKVLEVLFSSVWKQAHCDRNTVCLEKRICESIDQVFSYIQNGQAPFTLHMTVLTSGTLHFH